MQGERVFVVPHTHWDREWYLPFEVFRERLVYLIDYLLDIMEKDPEYFFYFDGQTIVLEDYEEIRGESRRLRDLIEKGRIGVGPWYVLPDEFLVSGESIIRNLSLGLKIARSLSRKLKPIGYLPDMFGHISQMPQILKGFGINNALLWRGVPKLEKDQFRWQAPDGSEVLGVYLPLGYGLAFELPKEPDEFISRLKFFLQFLKINDKSGVYLLLLGTDHWLPSASLSEVIKSARALEPELELKISTISDYLDELSSRIDGLVVYKGELRSCSRSQILPGVASSRIYLKIANHKATALLEKYLEPLSAFLKFYNGEDLTDWLNYLWKLLLINHPHDSICGCGIDPVHKEMEIRFLKLIQLGERLLGRVEEHLLLKGIAQKEFVFVFNPNPVQIPAVVQAELEFQPAGRRMLVDEKGRVISLEFIEKISKKKIIFKSRFPSPIAPLVLVMFAGEEIFGLFPQVVKIRKKGDCLMLRVGLSNKSCGIKPKEVIDKVLFRIKSEGISFVDLEFYQVPCYRIGFIAPKLKGASLNKFRLVKFSSTKAQSRIQAGDKFLENEFLKIQVDEGGKLEIFEKKQLKRIQGLVFREVGDRGDSYNFDPVTDDLPIEKPVRFSSELRYKGHSIAELLLRHWFRFPYSLSSDRARRSTKLVTQEFITRVTIYSGLRRVDFCTKFTNRSLDHRVQVGFYVPFEAEEIFSETPFDLVSRQTKPTEPPQSLDLSSLSNMVLGTEATYSTQPHSNFCAISDGSLGIILAQRGLCEVEAIKETGRTWLALTLVRSIGWLSRGDLSYRTQIAGPPIEVPDAQCLRDIEAHYSLMLFSGMVEEAPVFSEAYSFSYPPIAFYGRAKDEPFEPPFEFEHSYIIPSAFYYSSEQGFILRLFNSSFLKESLFLRHSRAFETPEMVSFLGEKQKIQSLRKDNNGIWLEFKPKEIITLKFKKR